MHEYWVLEIVPDSYVGPYEVVSSYVHMKTGLLPLSDVQERLEYYPQTALLV